MMNYCKKCSGKCTTKCYMPDCKCSETCECECKGACCAKKKCDQCPCNQEEVE